MNGKASKQTLVWPPLLNMAEENHKVDTTFQNWEKFNAPIVNDRIQNLYLQDTESPDTIYSRKGDAYNLDTEGYLCKNGERIIDSPRFNTSVEKEKIEFLKGASEMCMDYEGNYYFYKNDYVYYYDASTQEIKQLYDYKINEASNAVRLITACQSDEYVDRMLSDVFLIRVERTANSPTINIYYYKYGELINQVASRLNYVISSNDVNLLTVNAHAEAYHGTAGIQVTVSAIKTNGTVSPLNNICLATCQWNTTWTSIRHMALQGLSNTGSTSSSIPRDSFYVSFNYSDTIVSGRCTKIGDYWYKVQDGDSSISVVTSRLPILFPTDYNPADSTKLAGVITLNEANGTSKNYNTYYYTIYTYLRTVTVRSVRKNLFQFRIVPSGYYRSGSTQDVFRVGNITDIGGQSFVNTIVTGNYVDNYGEDSDEHYIVSDLGYVNTITFKITSTQSLSVGYNGKVSNKTLNYLDIILDSNQIWTNVPSEYWDGATLWDWPRTSTIYKNIHRAVAITDSGSMITLGVPTVNISNDISNYGTGYAFANGYVGELDTNGQFNSYPTSNELRETQIFRSGSLAIAGHNYIAVTAKYCNNTATAPIVLNNGVTESATARFTEVYLDTNRTIRYLPGTTRSSSFNYLSYALTGLRNVLGKSEDNLIYTVGGVYVNIGSYRLICNTELAEDCVVSGINTNYNVLLTPWYTVDKYYIPLTETALAGSQLFYRDSDTKAWYLITTYNNKVPKLKGIMNNRYIVVPNNDEIKMLYDTDKGVFYDYAFGFNDCYQFGQSDYASVTGSISTGSSSVPINYIKYTASAVNANYSRTGIPTTTVLPPVTPRYRCTAMDIDLNIPDVDVYYTVDSNSTTPLYRFSMGHSIKHYKEELKDASYPFTTSSSNVLSANLFTEYIDQSGNNDLAKEDEFTTYTLNYLDNNPIFSYSALTRVSTGAFTDANFFVIQGQFFGYYNDKIYALSYSGGTLVAQDPIVDCRGMLFVGNNPEIAFFWSPQNRAFYSFTGDCKLLQIYDGSKFENVTGKYWYDELGQNIYVDTDKGLLVFGARNTYLIEELSNTTDVFISQDGITHIYANDTLYNLKYYEDEEYEVIPLDLETSFYGLGSTESTSIDRWNITVYDTGHRACTIKVGVRTLTDITVKSEEKEYKITPDMYDKWSHCILLSYVPKLIKGQGIRLYVKSPINVASIVPHIMDNGTGTPTKRGL